MSKRLSCAVALLMAAALAGAAAAGPTGAPASAVNPIPATPYAPLPDSATQPPSGEAVALLPTTVAVPAEPEATVRAGVGVVDATWHVGASAGQYAGERYEDIADDVADDPVTLHLSDPYLLSIRRTPSYGIQSRLSVRALVIEGTDGTRMALVTNELYIPQDLLNQRVATILEQHDLEVGLGLRDGPVVGIDHSNMAISVSHSHTSPYYSAAAWGVWLFQDVFDLRFFEYLAQRHAQAVVDAVAALRPVRIGGVAVPFDNTQRHSFGPALADDGSPAGYPQRDNDHAMNVLRLDDISDRSNPRPYAIYAAIGQHPEMLEGNNLISGEFVQAALRMVEVASGATALFSQTNTGTSEPDTQGRAHAPAVRAEYSHREYAQMERAARQIANGILEGANAIGTDSPPAEGGYAPYALDPVIAVSDRQFAPPVSHPYPSVSNCRTHEAFTGNPGIPIVGLPDCDRTPGDVLEPVVGELENTPLDPGLTYNELVAAGVPIPANYGAPSYAAVQETFQVHLQAFRIGDIAVTVCPCEQWADQSRNIRSRLDRTEGNIFLGWDWTEFCVQGDGGDWTCPDPRAVDTWADDPSSPPEGGTVTVSDAAVQRARAHVRNDAAGWDSPENLLNAEVEPVDPADILGNYTHTEVPAASGYSLVIPLSMANDYWGYIATYREYSRGDHYRKALTGLGAHSSDWLATRLVAMAATLNGYAPMAGIIEYGPLDELYAIDGVHQHARALALGVDAAVLVALYEALLPADTGPPAALVQPTDVTRFDVAQFTWRGGSNYTDDPYAVVERETAPGQWEPYGDMRGDVVVTVDFPDDLVEEAATLLTGSFEWQWTAHFEAFSSDIDTATGPQTPAGRYRFVVTGQHRTGLPSRPAPYRVESEPFEVAPWDGITVEDLRTEPDGSVSFLVGPTNVHWFETADYPDGGDPVQVVVGPIDYPDSWPADKLPAVAETGRRTFPRLQRNLMAGEQRYCFPCTFRPWADVGEVRSATVTVTRAGGAVEHVTAVRGDDGRWRADTGLGDGDVAAVAAGGIVDTFGEVNGAASPAVAATSGPAPLTSLPATGSGGVPLVAVIAVLGALAARGPWRRRQASG